MNLSGLAILFLFKVVLLRATEALSDLEERFRQVEERLTQLEQQKGQNVIAFTAYHDDDEYAYYDVGQTYLFPHVITNLGGAYDESTSHFTCPVTGTYYFAVHADCFTNAGFMAGIYKGDNLIASANGHSAEQRQSSMGVVIECAAGEQVDVRSVEIVSVIIDYNAHRTTVFMGFLISI